jgi:hypothetical protein
MHRNLKTKAKRTKYSQISLHCESNSQYWNDRILIEYNCRSQAKTESM